MAHESGFTDPHDTYLVRDFLKLAEIHEENLKAAQSSTEHDGYFERLERAAESTIVIETKLESLSDGDLGLLYTLWNAGRAYTPEAPSLDRYAPEFYEGWRRDACSTLENSPELSLYLREGADLFGYL